MKRLLLTLALVASLPGIAHAARLVSPPIDPPQPGNAEGLGRFSCAARYLGSTSASVTIRAFSGGQNLGVRTLRLTPAAPAGSLAGLCGDEFGLDQVCRQFVCTFNSPASAADLRGSACVGSASATPVCLGATP